MILSAKMQALLTRKISERRAKKAAELEAEWQVIQAGWGEAV